MGFPTLAATDLASASPFLRLLPPPNPRPPPLRRRANPGSSTRFCSLQASSCLRRHILAYACVRAGGGFEQPAGPEVSGSDPKEVVFDTKLPRRNLLVKFTCKSCGERTQRMINRLAYERGTVFVQCAGCLVNHKLVDNLGLVVEYDLRNDTQTDCDTMTPS